MKIFSIDSPVMVFLGRVADLMWLNILTLLCCIPIVTAGASITAMHYVALKIVRKEECYITRSFFKSFKQNFKQATIIWLLFLVGVIFIVTDYLLVLEMEGTMRTVFRGVILVAGIFILFVSTLAFPVLAKFDNSIKNTLKNALFISILQFPKTILMIVMNVAPAVLFVVSMDLVPFVILFGLSLPSLGGAFLYNKFFQKMEDQILEANPVEASDPGEEDEHIFSDELDESIANQ